MIRKKKGIWALFLTAALVAAQLPFTAAAAQEGNASVHDKIQPNDVSIKKIDVSEIMSLMSGAQEHTNLLLSNSQPTLVKELAWERLEGFQCISRSLSKEESIMVQITLPQPTQIHRDLWVSGSTEGEEVERIQNLFNQYYKNVMDVIHFDEPGDWGQPAGIAIRPPAGSEINSLTFYSYNITTNTYRLVPNPEPWLDSAGWLHFTTPYSGELIVSDGELELRDTPLPVSNSQNVISNRDGGSLPPYVDPDPDPEPEPRPNPKPNPKPELADPSINITEQSNSLVAMQEGSLQFGIITENIKNGETLTITRGEGIPDGLRFETSQVTVDEATLTVTNDGSVGAGSYPFTVSYGNASANGTVHVVAPSIEITQVKMLDDFVGFTVELSSPTNKPLELDAFQLFDENNAPLKLLEEVTVSDSNQTYTVTFKKEDPFFYQEKSHTLQITINGETLTEKIEPVKKTTVTTQEELQQALDDGSGEITLTGNEAYNLDGEIGDNVELTIAENAELTLNASITSSNIHISVDNSGKMTGYETIGNDNTVTAIAGASLTASDGSELVGSDSAPIQLQNGSSVVIKGNTAGYDIHINGGATIGTAATRRAAAPSLVLDGGVNLFINGRVTVTGSGGQGPVLDIRTGSEVVVESGALVVDDKGLVAGGERIRGEVVDSNGEPVDFTSPPPVQPQIKVDDNIYTMSGTPLSFYVYAPGIPNDSKPTITWDSEPEATIIKNSFSNGAAINRD